MYSSSDRASAQQHVPAWKKLGLKLKPAAASDPANSSPGVGHPSSSASAHHSPSNKRRLDAPPAGRSALADKRPRRDDVAAASRNAHVARPKSVSFGDTPTKNGVRRPVGQSTTPAKESKSKSKGPAKKQTQPTTDLKPALEYLRQWKSSRETWKFNKNHQSGLIKHAFDTNLPAADVGIFYEYIRDLKGYIRTRLREDAMEIRTKDAAAGAAGFPEDLMDLDKTQSTYESLLTELLQVQQPGNKRKAFNEPEFVGSTKEKKVVVQRIIKRMRAEMVLEELSDGAETETSTTSTSSGTLVNSDGPTADGEKRVKLNDGSGKRRRKLRVNLDDSSSSESESDSDSDTSSSGSSDDSDDEAEQEAGDESSSSSSSSSSSDDEGGSEAESEEEL